MKSRSLFATLVLALGLSLGTPAGQLEAAPPSAEVLFEDALDAWQLTQARERLAAISDGTPCS